MSQITMDSKCFKTPHGVTVYHTEAERVEQRVPSSTVGHNHVAAMQCSRRKKIVVQNDNMLTRKNKVRARLLKRLAEKKLKKKQKKWTW